MGLLATPQGAESGGIGRLTHKSSVDSSELSYTEMPSRKGQLYVWLEHCSLIARN